MIEKPWGKEEIIEINSHYMLKKLVMLAGHRCSLQYHRYKTETIYVLSGALKISLGITAEKMEDKIYLSGESLTIQPKLLHRMEGIEDTIYLEASTPELDDVVRILDDYQR